MDWQTKTKYIFYLTGVFSKTVTGINSSASVLQELEFILEWELEFKLELWIELELGFNLAEELELSLLQKLELELELVSSTILNISSMENKFSNNSISFVTFSNIFLFRFNN